MKIDHKDLQTLEPGTVVWVAWVTYATPARGLHGWATEATTFDDLNEAVAYAEERVAHYRRRRIFKSAKVWKKVIGDQSFRTDTVWTATKKRTRAKLH